MTSLLSDVIKRGLRSAQPTPTTGTLAGMLYYVTDEFKTERWSGTAWQDVSDAGSGIAVTIIDAKGDILAGTANDAIDNLTVGSNGKVLTAASGEATGLKWENPWVGSHASLQFQIDGGGSVITTGVKGFIEAPFAATIVGVRVLLDQSGSIVIDVWKDTYANYPPVNGDSITASANPTVSSAVKSEDTTLTGWTTSIAEGDILGFNVDSATTATRATIVLDLVRT